MTRSPTLVLRFIGMEIAKGILNSLLLIEVNFCVFVCVLNQCINAFYLQALKIYQAPINTLNNLILYI